MTYQEITEHIKSLRKDLELAILSNSLKEINYFEIELMVAEDYLDRMIDKGRR